MAWRRSGVAPSPPGISDPHGLNGLVAEVGWCPDREKLSNVSASRLEIRSADGATKIALAGSVVTLGSDTGADFVALASKVEELVAFAIANHTHAGVTVGTGTTAIGLSSGIAPTVAAGKVKAS